VGSDLQVRVVVVRVPILAVVAGPVAHGMGVLTLDDRAMLQEVVSQARDLGDAGVHGADNVGSRGLGAAPLIVHRSAGIPGADVPCQNDRGHLKHF
jgi:hypothetical protein